MDKFILLYGQKRFGNHLLSNWILSGGDWDYENDIFPYDRDFSRDDVVNLIYKKRFKNTIFTLENLHKIKKDDINWIVNTIKFKSKVKVGLIRSPDNWLVSYAAMLAKNKNFSIQVSDLINVINNFNPWEMYEDAIDKWFMADIKVRFDDFVKSKDYRQLLAEKLGVLFDSKIDEVVMDTLWKPPAVYFASSFDEDMVKAKKLKPSDMKVLNRTENYQELFKLFPVPAKIADFWDRSSEVVS
jgi:hypothetical protein